MLTPIFVGTASGLVKNTLFRTYVPKKQGKSLFGVAEAVEIISKSTK
jgi:hypothetical protein